MAFGIFGVDVNNGLETREKKLQKEEPQLRGLRVEAPGLVRMFIRDLINTPERTIIFQKRTFLNNPLLRYNVLAKVRDEKTGEILRYLPFFGM